MQPQTAPRDYTPGAGLPGDRSARLAAGLAFARLKHGYLQALESAPGAEWLRVQVRAAEEPVDLWLLRAPVFAALGDGDGDAERRERRQMLHRNLDSMFPDLYSGSAFLPF